MNLCFLSSYQMGHALWFNFSKLMFRFLLMKKCARIFLISNPTDQCAFFASALMPGTKYDSKNLLRKSSGKENSIIRDKSVDPPLFKKSLVFYDTIKESKTEILLYTRDNIISVRLIKLWSNNLFSPYSKMLLDIVIRLDVVSLIHISFTIKDVGHRSEGMICWKFEQVAFHKDLTFSNGSFWNIASLKEICWRKS